MSTVAEIKDAIEKLSLAEKHLLESLIWPDWDRPEGDTPPDVREKLAEAEKGRFTQGDRSNAKKVLSGLG